MHHFNGFSWELYCHEHGIEKDGFGLKAGANAGVNSFFNEKQGGKYIPRSIFVDLEPSAIDQVRSGEYSRLHHPGQLLNGKEDASDNYARGRYTVGQNMLELTLESIRRTAEQCDCKLNLYYRY